MSLAKYSFWAQIKSMSEISTRLYHAQSSNKAHKLRAKVARNKNVLFLSGIQKANEGKIPISIKLTNIKHLSDFKRVDQYGRAAD